MIDRKKIAERMQRLARMTTENGCTEAEANNALSMLAGLQVQYNMTLNQAEVISEPITMGIIKNVENEAVYMAVRGIGKATDTAAVIDTASNSIIFIGSAHDIEYATYLFHIVFVAAETLFNKFIPTPDYTRLRKAGASEPHIRLSYTVGVVERLNSRILAMLKPIELESTKGREIMVIKQDKAQQTLEQLGLETKAISTDIAILREVKEAGEEAANDVALNKGINSNNTDKRLN